MDRIEQQWADGREAAYYAGQAAQDRAADLIEERCERVPDALAATEGCELLDWIANHPEGLMQARLELLVQAVMTLGTARDKHAAARAIVDHAQTLVTTMIEAKCAEIESES